MDHARERETGSIHRAHSILGEADTFVAFEDGSEIATIAAGDEAVALTQLGRDMSNLEAVGFAGINGAAERLEALHEERADEVRLEATSLGLFHFFLHREEALRAHAFRGKCLSVEDGDYVVAVEGIVDFLAKTGANFRLVAVANGFQQHFLEAVAVKDFAQNVEHLSLERLAHHAKFFEQAEIDITLAGFLGY